ISGCGAEPGIRQLPAHVAASPFHHLTPGATRVGVVSNATVEKNEERVDDVSLFRHRLPGLVAHDLAMRYQPLELRTRCAAEQPVRRKAREQYGVATAGYRSAHRGHTVCRYWWIMLTVADPSPTAAATRLPDPWRASPAQKIPGTFVSKRYGSRPAVQPAG